METELGMDLSEKAGESITLDQYRSSKTASPVIIKNCVATAFFGTNLDLEEISWKKFGEFNPSSFAAAKFRLSSPSTTALIFASGKIVCTGAASEDSAIVAILKYFQMVNSVDSHAVCLDICIENIVGTAYLGHALNLQATFDWLKSQGYVTAMYSPELFPGLRFVPRDLAPRLPPTKVLVFQEGNVVICGAKARDELLQTWVILRQILKQFEQETVRTHYLCT
jgi:transcription initiation factor TFIID TATA-box-binding protein